jgi:hypothetical protein
MLALDARQSKNCQCCKNKRSAYVGRFPFLIYISSSNHLIALFDTIMDPLGDL